MPTHPEQEQIVREKYRTLDQIFDERSRRYWAATEALAIGYGGVSLVARATGLSRKTISAGIRHIKEGADIPVSSGRIRRAGGGRSSIVQNHPHIRQALETLLDPIDGASARPALRWTCKSMRTLALELRQHDHDVSHRTVSTILQEMGYRIQTAKNRQNPATAACRNAQFTYINTRAQNFLQQGKPVIAVDVNLDEIQGELKPAGSVTSLILACLQQWWNTIGSVSYPYAQELLLTVNTGLSREYVWNTVFQKFSNHCRCAVALCYFPSGISRWQYAEQIIRSRFDEFRQETALALRSVALSIIADSNSISITSKNTIKNSQLQGTTDVTREDPEDFQEWNYLLTPQSDKS